MAILMASGRADDPQAVRAGEACAEQCRAQLDGWPPRLLLVFAAPDLDHAEVLRGIARVFPEVPAIGCTTAAAFTPHGSGGVAVTALAGSDLRVRIGTGTHHGQDLAEAVTAATAAFARRADGDLDPRWRGRSLLLFADGRADSDVLLQQLHQKTGAHYQVFGALAAGPRQQAAVFGGGRVQRSAFACAEVLSAKPFRLGIGHGFRATGSPMRVSAVRGPWLAGLDDQPAWTAMQERLGPAAVTFAVDAAPPPDLLLGVLRGSGHDLRVLLQRRDDGAVRLSHPVAVGDVVQCMRADRTEVLDAGQQAVRAARGELEPAAFAGALVIECPTTQGVLGTAFQDHVDRTLQALAAPAATTLAVQGGFATTDGAVLAPLDAGSLVCLIPV